MSFEVERVIAEHHPALAGHFPKHPVVPGVLILDEVLQAARQWRGRVRLATIESVKFISPLEPGHPFTIELRETAPSRIVFECRRAGAAVASGTIAVAPDTSDT